jgi:hypothetical protein
MKQTSVRDLESIHRSLDLQIHKLERRGYHMTPFEQLRATALKKLRLRTKDKLETFRR